MNRGSLVLCAAVIAVMAAWVMRARRNSEIDCGHDDFGSELLLGR
ncbi:MULTISPECIES: hypothetical protein [unclassified Nocardia]|nr:MULTISPECIES: hypothetical protein [unclassified Nocardia]